MNIVLRMHFVVQRREEFLAVCWPVAITCTTSMPRPYTIRTWLFDRARACARGACFRIFESQSTCGSRWILWDVLLVPFTVP